MAMIFAKIGSLLGLSSLRAWFMVALVAGSAAFIGGVYMKGRSDAGTKAKITRLEKENEALRRLYKSKQDMAERQAKTQADRDKKLQELQVYVDKLESRDDACFSGDDVIRLQDIIGK